MRAFESYLAEAMLVDIRSGQRLAIAKEKSRLIFRKLGKGFVHFFTKINLTDGCDCFWVLQISPIARFISGSKDKGRRDCGSPSVVFSLSGPDVCRADVPHAPWSSMIVRDSE